MTITPLAKRRKLLDIKEGTSNESHAVQKSIAQYFSSPQGVSSAVRTSISAPSSLQKLHTLQSKFSSTFTAATTRQNVSLLYKGAPSLVKTASGEEADSPIKTNRATVVREHLLGAGWKDFEFEIEKRAATKQAAVEESYGFSAPRKAGYGTCNLSFLYRVVAQHHFAFTSV